MINWYAIYTRPRHEKKVRDLLEEKNQEVFLPLVTEVHLWKDRKKKVEVPLFKSYLFVRIDYKQRFSVLETNGIVKIVNFRNEPAVVPAWQIDSLKMILEHPETLRLEKYIKPGEIVDVIAGPFKGMKGMVRNLKGETRIVVAIEGLMQSVSVEIDSDMVKKIEENKAV
ncbi:MAG: UpxY family transcription antiterminator [Calditrichaceae bacterium]